MLDNGAGFRQGRGMTKRAFTVTLTIAGLRQAVSVRAESEDHAISRAVTRLWGPRAYLEPGELLDKIVELYPHAPRVTRVLAAGVLVEVA